VYVTEAATEAVRALIPNVVNCSSARRRGGRVAECGGLLNKAKPLLGACFQRLGLWQVDCVDRI
jgi:hypothetical protein